jgi:hypothetical protein
VLKISTALRFHSSVALREMTVCPDKTEAGTYGLILPHRHRAPPRDNKSLAWRDGNFAETICKIELATWIEVLKNDNRAIFAATAQAQTSSRLPQPKIRHCAGHWDLRSLMQSAVVRLQRQQGKRCSN